MVYKQINIIKNKLSDVWHKIKWEMRDKRRETGDRGQETELGDMRQELETGDGKIY